MKVLALLENKMVNGGCGEAKKLDKNIADDLAEIAPGVDYKPSITGNGSDLGF